MINLKMRILFVLSFLICSQASAAQVRLNDSDVQKLILETSKPTYTEGEKILRMQGEIKVDVTVSDKGVVEKVKFISGNSLLIGSANKTIKSYRFKPYETDGKAASFITTLNLFFSFGATKKEVEDEMATAKKYYAENDKCRQLYRDKKYSEAETSCKLAVSIAEQLPKTRYMEKHSAYRMLGATLLWERKFEESIVYFNKALEIGKPNVDDNNAETGEVYYFIGQANYLLGRVDAAREFYVKAENSYRAAFKEMGDSEIREFYPKPIISILQAHLILLEDAGMKEESAKVEKRLAETKIEFAKYIDK